MLKSGDQLGDLSILDELGRGAYATVYLAEDRLLGRKVALKVLDLLARPDDQPAERLLHEARIVAGLTSPHIVTLFRVHSLPRERLAFEMEYVSGGTLSERIKAAGRLGEPEVVRILKGMLRALGEAHKRGVIHHDIKPGNILLDADGTAKLADFGLGLMPSEGSLSRDRRPRGTPLYMAPEVAMGDGPTFASDIWSLGVVAYRMLTGHRPFRGDNLPALFMAILNAAPRPIGPTVSRGLAEVTLQCLGKNVEARPSIEELLERLDEPTRAQGSETTPVGGTPTAYFVGRESESAQLDAALARAGTGDGQAVLVSGVAGIGKTTLVEELSDRARRRGFRWLTVQMTPLAGLQQLLLTAVQDELIQTSRSETDRSVDDTELAAPLRRHQAALAIHDALTNATQHAPVAIHIEDAQLCTQDDLLLLRDLIQRLASAPALLIVAYRTQDPSGSDSSMGLGAGAHEFADIENLAYVELGPLDEHELYVLIQTQADGRMVAAEIMRRIIEKSGGVPLFALGLFRHLEEVGEIERTRDTIRPGPRWGREPLPRRFHEIVARRLDGLDADIRDILDAAAVDGVEFDAEAVASTLDVGVLPILRTLQRMHRERALIDASRDGYRFAHPLLHEIIYAELAPPLRRSLHRHLADHLETRKERVDPERLGTHWLRAGDPDRARPYLCDAIVRASARQEHHRAIDLAVQAGLLPASDPARLRADADLHFQLAGSLHDVGHLDEVHDLLARMQTAAEEIGDDVLAIRTQVWTSDFELGARGSQNIDEAVLREASERLPNCRELGVARYVLGRLARGNGQPEIARRWLVEADVAFRDAGDEWYRPTILHALGTVAAALGRHEEAEEHFEHAAERAERMGAQSNAAISRITAARNAYSRGELDGVEERFETSIRTLSLTGADDKAAFSRVYLAEAQYAKGHPDAAYANIETALRVLRQRELVYGLIEALVELGHLHAARGKLQEARASLDEAAQVAKDAADQVGMLMAAADLLQWHCFAGDLDAAQSEVARALQIARESKDTSTLSRLGLMVAEAGLFGLPQSSLVATYELLASDVEALETARAALRGAQALACGESLGLADGIAAFRAPHVGLRHAEFGIVAALLEAEHADKEGRRGQARECATQAAADAHGLQHVWLELRALSTLRRLDAWDDARMDRAWRLLSAARAAAPSAAQADLIDRAWSP